MAISTPSSRSALALGAALLASSALAQDTARQRIEAAGARAGQRLEDALARAKAAPGADPRMVEMPVATDAVRRRTDAAMDRQRGSQRMQERAAQAAARAEAQLAAQRAAMAERLKIALGLTPEEKTAIARKPAAAGSTWVPVLFVSSSIPLAVLRAYASQLERVHGVLAFRGMPGGLRRVAPMAKLSAEILRLDPGCEGPACAMRNVQIVVDPIAFRQHGIARVPALAMLPGDPAQAYCERDETSMRASHVVFGDAALSGLLEEYGRLGGAAQVRDAQALLGAR